MKVLTHIRDLERTVGIIDPEWIKLGSRKYYRYIGSLTVPPCTQDVVWTIVRKVSEAYFSHFVYIIKH